MGGFVAGAMGAGAGVATTCEGTIGMGAAGAGDGSTLVGYGSE